MKYKSLSFWIVFLLIFVASVGLLANLGSQTYSANTRVLLTETEGGSEQTETPSETDTGDAPSDASEAQPSTGGGSGTTDASSDDSSIGDRLEELGNKIGNEASSWWDKFVEWISDRWNDTKNWFSDRWADVSDWCNNLPEWAYWAGGFGLGTILLIILYLIFRPRNGNKK